MNKLKKIFMFFMKKCLSSFSFFNFILFRFIKSNVFIEFQYLFNIQCLNIFLFFYFIRVIKLILNSNSVI